MARAAGVRDAAAAAGPVAGVPGCNPDDLDGRRADLGALPALLRRRTPRGGHVPCGDNRLTTSSLTLPPRRRHAPVFGCARTDEIDQGRRLPDGAPTNRCRVVLTSRYATAGASGSAGAARSGWPGDERCARAFRAGVRQHFDDRWSAVMARSKVLMRWSGRQDYVGQALGVQARNAWRRRHPRQVDEEAELPTRAISSEGR